MSGAVSLYETERKCGARNVHEVAQQASAGGGF